jgi:hypothetical protein
MSRTPQRLRVAKIDVEGFRGSSGALQVGLTARSGETPVSALIFGENGTGKSTLVDAVEVCLQGTVGREGVVGPERPALVSLAGASGSASCTVTMNDGAEYRQQLAWKHDGDGSRRLVRSHVGRRPGFDLAPISLKRADILRFLDTPSVKRGMVFLDYFPVSSPMSEGDADLRGIEYELQVRLAEVRQERRDLGRRIAQGLGVENPPTDAQEFDNLMGRLLYRGLDPSKARARGVRVRMPKSVGRDVNKYNELRGREKQLKRQIRSGKPRTSEMVKRLQQASASLADISTLLTESFDSVTGAPHVRALEVRFGAASEVALEVVVHLANGREASVQQVFSEGYQDLVALLFFLAVAQEAASRGQAKVLILDDVLQSVDAGFRSRLMDHALNSMSDWQLLVTVHDRLWRSQIREQFRRNSHRFVDVELGRWDFATGLNVTNAATDETALHTALSSGLPASIAAEAGRLLEQLSDRLSWTLGSSIKRKRDDRYTLGDLWPGVLKELKRTSVKAEALEVDRWVSLRNMVGAHYNEWAEGVSVEEARNFGFAVLALLARLRCGDCGLWVESTRRCRCGAVTLDQ